jgi:hypothetical protein
MKTPQSRVNGIITKMYVCCTCNAFFAISGDNIIQKYYFVCTEINDQPQGNYIVEQNPKNKTTIIKFLPIEETPRDIDTVCVFDSLLPLTPQNVMRKIKTYILFS